MATISHIVKQMIKDKPFIEEALARGIINYAALAEELRPGISSELGKKVKTSAVMMALRRLAEGLKIKFKKEKIRFDEGDITIRSDLFEVTILKSSSVVNNIRRLYDLVDFSRGDLLTITQGIYEVTIITNKRYRARVMKILEKEEIVKTINDLSSLTIKIPLKAVETSGFFYFITKALHWNNINIIEIVSTLTEMTLILDEKDVPRTFSTIKELV
jgi:aspartokinase